MGREECGLTQEYTSLRSIRYGMYICRAVKGGCSEEPCQVAFPTYIIGKKVSLFSSSTSVDKPVLYSHSICSVIFLRCSPSRVNCSSISCSASSTSGFKALWRSGIGMRYGCGDLVEELFEEAGVGSGLDVRLSVPVKREATLSVGAMVNVLMEV